MDFVNRTLECVECGAAFTFSAAEQELFASRGFQNDPKRCLDCREARKRRRGEEGGGEGPGYRRREMFPAVCAACGKDTQVPFEPRQGRPVYCSECYAKARLEGSA